MENFLNMEFKSVSENEALARMAIAAFIMPLDPTFDELTDIKTSVSEAVTNAIIHGYEGKIGIVTIKAALSGTLLTISVEDNGKGIKDVEKAKEPLFTTKPELERSGMGFTIIESFMDNLIIDSKENEGTKVIMIKEINRDKEDLINDIF